jgi:hypothetical protein
MAMGSLPLGEENGEGKPPMHAGLLRSVQRERLDWLEGFKGWLNNAPGANARKIAIRRGTDWTRTGRNSCGRWWRAGSDGMPIWRRSSA